MGHKKPRHRIFRLGMVHPNQAIRIRRAQGRFERYGVIRSALFESYANSLRQEVLAYSRHAYINPRIWDIALVCEDIIRLLGKYRPLLHAIVKLLQKNSAVRLIARHSCYIDAVQDVYGIRIHMCAQVAHLGITTGGSTGFRLAFINCKSYEDLLLLLDSVSEWYLVLPLIAEEVLEDFWPEGPWVLHEPI